VHHRFSGALVKLVKDAALAAAADTSGVKAQSFRTVTCTPEGVLHAIKAQQRSLITGN
jgi:hypothetical protein